eukprot:m.224514 g.224514  ORF g.224514 m.224514 type:complete len:698 (-) comp33433_c0_seq1:346-2439(-)
MSHPQSRFRKARVKVRPPREQLSFQLARLIAWSKWLPEPLGNEVTANTLKGIDSWETWLASLSQVRVHDALAVQRVLAQLWIDCLYPEHALASNVASIRQACEALDGDEVLMSSGQGPCVLPHIADLIYSLEEDVPLLNRIRTQARKSEEELHASKSWQAREKEIEFNRMAMIIKVLSEYLPFSEPFLAKVLKKDVSDYYEVILNPMDLGTMMRKLKDGNYESNWPLFESDLYLIYENCRTYNYSEGNAYAAMANTMEKRTRLLLDAVAAENEITFNKSNVPSTELSDQLTSENIYGDEESWTDPRLSEYRMKTEKVRLRKLQRQHENQLKPIGAQSTLVRKRRMLTSYTHRTAACDLTTHPEIILPELQHVMESLPPACYQSNPPKPAVSSTTQWRTCLTNPRNPILRNIRTIQNIRLHRKMILNRGRGSHTHVGHGVTDVNKTLFSKPADDDPNISPTQRITGDLASELMCRGVAVLLMHGGFEDVDSRALHLCTNLASHFLDDLCKSMRGFRDGCSSDNDLMEVATNATRRMSEGGIAGLTRYHRDDVTGFGAQLRQINNKLKAKYHILMAIDNVAEDCIENTASFFNGNFGENVDGLGLDILGLKELGLAEREGVPISLWENHGAVAGTIRNLKQPVPAPTAISKSRIIKPPTTPIPIRKFKIPPSWPPIKSSAGQIGMLKTFFDDHLKASQS